MANPTCTVASLVTNYPQFTRDAVNLKEREALKVWFLANELKAIGGTDYTALLTSVATGGLQAAQNDLFEKVTEDDRETALTAIYFNNAVAAGASVSSNPVTFAQSIKCLESVDMWDLQAMQLLLLCKLGVHKAYVQ